jgi:hypothetical protein
MAQGWALDDHEPASLPGIRVDDDARLGERGMRRREEEQSGGQREHESRAQLSSLDQHHYIPFYSDVVDQIKRIISLCRANK